MKKQIPPEGNFYPTLNSSSFSVQESSSFSSHPPPPSRYPPPQNIENCRILNNSPAKKRNSTATRLLNLEKSKASQNSPTSLLKWVKIRRNSNSNSSYAHCEKWTCFQVAVFLEACGLGAYAQCFQDQGIDGEMLLELSPDLIERNTHMKDRMHMISLVTGVRLLCEGKIRKIEEWEWSMNRTTEWLHAKGLDCLIGRFQHLAVHGGVLFELTQEEFVSELEIDNEMILMSLMTSIERAREVGPLKFGEAVPDWSLTQVKQWLEGISLAHLYSTFRKFGVNGSLLLFLDRDMMTFQMGLTEIQAMVVEKAIAKLLKQIQDSKRWYRRLSGTGLPGNLIDVPFAVPADRYPRS